MEWLFNLIKDLIDKKFTGSVKINFFQGGISNINKEESIKPQPNKKEG
jgi:hypothetical protein